MWNKVFFVCALFLAQADCLKLLLVFPIPAPSHYFLGNELGKKLAKLGHNVTIVAAYEEKNPPPNYRIVYLDGLAEHKQGIKSGLIISIKVKSV